MKNNPNKNRRSIRLKEYDYTQPGAYFITIDVQDRIHLFGVIRDGRMQLNTFGECIRNEWLKTPEMRPNVRLDELVIMPDHMHGIIVIVDDSDSRTGVLENKTDSRTGVLPYAPTETAPTFKSPSKTIGAIIRGFKSATAKKINQMRQAFGAPVWQRNYYERIIRDENELSRIREYIINNPLKWESEKNRKGIEKDVEEIRGMMK